MDSFDVIISPKALSQLKKNGYHPINFLRHHYLMLYRIEGKAAYVDAIYHQLQDYEKFLQMNQVFYRKRAVRK